MRAFAQRHMQMDLMPEDMGNQRSRLTWVLGSCLRAFHPKSLNWAQHTNSQLTLRIYSMYNAIEPMEPNDNEGESVAVNRFNGCRLDLIAEWVDPPEECGIREFPYEPDGDPSYWLAKHVLGYEDLHISALCDIPLSELADPGRKLVPLLKSSMKWLKGLTFDSEELTRYHNARYRLLRYYLDAVYHEL